MKRSIILASWLAFGTLVHLPAGAQAPEPTLPQVYEAEKAGHFADAQAMMDRVLRDHPNSATAHYVEAELLARQGKFAAAGAELDTAERIAPGLPKEDPRAVAQLRQEIAGATRAHPASPVVQSERAAPSASSSFGWVLPVVIIGAILLLIVLIRATRQVQPVGMGGYNQIPQGGGMPGYGPGMAPVYPMGPMGGGGGLGSSIVGGLATGAALGAGLVAGEELMHHFTDGNRGPGYVPPMADNSGLADDRGVNDNMGGDNFGVRDASSWDDSSSLGDSLGGGGDGGGGDWS